MRALNLDQLRETGSLADSGVGSLVSGDADTDRIVLWLDTVLDEAYVLIRNVELPQAHTPIDFLVAGPPGIWALYVEADAGQFRSDGGAFFSWETRAGGYVQISPNPLLILKSQLSQIRSWLKSQRLPESYARTAILFTDPAAVVESAGEDVQLVGPQLVESYPVEIANAGAVLDEAAVERFLLAVARGKLPPPPPLNLGELEQGDSVATFWSRFKPWQWAVLGGLALLNVVILGGFCYWAVFLNA